MLHDDLQPFARQIVPTGSHYICNPPVEDTDEDYVVLASFYSADELVLHMEGNGYTTDGDESYEILCALEDDRSGWASFKNGKLNYIIMRDEEFFDKWVLATNIAKRLNLREKEDRINLFQFILYEARVYYEHNEGIRIPKTPSNWYSLV